jgi:periplasmic divalent cation tolerance protein
MSSDDREAVIVLTTTGSAGEARTIAQALVAERLAACVNVLADMISIYRWEGAVQEEQECQLVIKTTRPRVEALRARVHELHSYDLPEFLVLEAGGSSAYVNWLARSTGTT